MPAALTPSMLTLVRESKGWTQRDLGTRAGVSQAFISQAETGRVDVPAERLELLARTLDCPASLLTAPEVRSLTAMSCLHHRRRASKLSAAASRRVEGLAYLTRLTVESVLDGLNARVETTLKPGLATPSADRGTDRHSEAGSGGDAQTRRHLAVQSARLVRETWGIGGPIPNLVSLLESQGFLVVVRPLGSNGQDAVSSWPANGDHPPVIVANVGLPTDRLRFTLAHELGHLLLHALPEEGQEEEADAFAAELLAPADEIGPSLNGLTTGDMRRLMALKSRWRVSIGALVSRARDLEKVSPRQYREFRLRLTRLGWDVNEPGDLTPEVPGLLDQAFALGRSRGLDEEALAEMALMTPEAFARHYAPTSTRQTCAPKQTLNSATTSPTTSTGEEQL